MNQSQIEYKLLKLRKRRQHATNKLAILSLMIDELQNKLEKEIDLDQGFGIYILKCHDMYKIGKTSNLKTRLRELQVGNPYPLKVVGFIPTDHKKMPILERLLHHRFGDLNINGEWFKLSENEIYFLNKLMNESTIDFEEQFKSFDKLLYDKYYNQNELLPIKTKDLKLLKLIIIVIRRLQIQNSEQRVLREEVIEEMKIAYGKDEIETALAIDQLRRDGDIFEPRPGVLRVP